MLFAGEPTIDSFSFLSVIFLIDLSIASFNVSNLFGWGDKVWFSVNNWADFKTVSYNSSNFFLEGAIFSTSAKFLTDKKTASLSSSIFFFS